MMRHPPNRVLSFINSIDELDALEAQIVRDLSSALYDVLDALEELLLSSSGVIIFSPCAMAARPPASCFNIKYGYNWVKKQIYLVCFLARPVWSYVELVKACIKVGENLFVLCH